MKILNITNGKGGEFVMTEKISDLLCHKYVSSILSIRSSNKYESLEAKPFFDEEIISLKKILFFIKKVKQNDIVLFHNIFNYTSILLLIIAKFQSKKNVVIMHNKIEGMEFGLKYFYLKVRKFVITNILMLTVNQIVFLTHNQGESFKRLALSKRLFTKLQVFIPNFISPNVVLKKVEPKEFGILFIGRFTKYKGFYDLLNVALTNQDINFCLVGGKYDKELTQHKNVFFIPEVRNEEIYKLLDKYPIIIVPSYSEVFPIVILEAMARGVVILTSNFGGVEEILTENENALFFKAGNTSEIKEKIKLIKSNSDLIVNISQNNIKRIKDFTSEKILDKYLNLMAQYDR